MNQNAALGTTYVEAADGYDIAGVPPGTLVACTVQFTVDSDVSTSCPVGTCGGVVGMRLRHGVQVAAQEHLVYLASGSQNLHDALQLPVTITAGHPEAIAFVLYGYRLAGEGTDGSDASGVISFAGLPAGANIISCHGYNPSPTPVKQGSWGRLKAYYR
jgi:hypothetical protein